MFHIALIDPEIPQNTGSISRLTVGIDGILHILGTPLFAIDDRRAKRAGLDHWDELRLKRHPDWHRFLVERPRERLVLLSKYGRRWIWEHSFQAWDYLVFGNETQGLPVPLLDEYADRLFALPILGPIRSQNLSNAATAVAYEGIRQLVVRGDLAPAFYLDKIDRLAPRDRALVRETKSPAETRLSGDPEPR